MTHRGHFHCQRCGTAFESSAAMKEHHRKEHMDQADGADGHSPSRTAQSETPAQGSIRKNKAFTRGHME